MFEKKSCDELKIKLGIAYLNDPRINIRINGAGKT